MLDVDGRYYMLRKIVPHQHKPERAGDPSPRCMACALRTMHERASVMLKARADSKEAGDLIPEDQVTLQAAKVIEDTIGLSF